MLARALPAVLALISIAASNRSAAQTPAPVNLALTPGGWGETKGVANGYVVGVAATANGENHAFLWTAATQTMRDINPAGCTSSVATGVNSHGAAVGLYNDPNGVPHAFYWDAVAGFVPIVTPNTSVSQVLIGDNGVVGGTDANGHVFRWTQTRGLQDLGPVLPGASPYDIGLSGINARGDIVGNAGSVGYAGYQVAFVAFASSNTPTILTSPGTAAPPSNVGATINVGNVDIQLSGINDNGVVVGTYWDFEYIYSGYDISQGGFFNADVHNSHAFKWTAAGGFVDLGNLGVSSLIGNPNPGFNSGANAINNAGVIAGTASLPAGGSAPWSYDPGTGKLTQLPGVNPYLGFAPTAINDDGVVAGSANAQWSAAVWYNGVFTTITPSFAPAYNGTPGYPLLKGSTFASIGYPNDYHTQYAWTTALVLAPPAPVVTSSSVTADYGSAFNYQILATNSPTTYTAGGLPAGLALNSASGLISGTLPNTLGTYAVGLSATNAGGTGSGTLTLTIVDPTPPKITSVTPSPASIWPPNKKMVPVTLSAVGANLGRDVVYKIISVTTNEPDGNTQWQVSGPLTLDLLADRLGTGTGRVYTITVQATDPAGSTSTATTTVSVPHDQGK